MGESVMNLSWLNPINKVLDIVSEAVPDKDKRDAIFARLEEVKQNVYLAELNTKTIPWVDAMHKMGRQVISLLPFVLLWVHPDIDVNTLLAASAPGGIYNYVKGRGK
jgi:hypothetical protein